MGPFVGRMYGWSPLLNAFNQVRLLCSTFYASIDSGHAFMKHTIITESKKSKNCSKGPCFSNGFELFNKRCEDYTPQNVKVKYDCEWFAFHISSGGHSCPS